MDNDGKLDYEQKTAENLAREQTNAFALALNKAHPEKMMAIVEPKKPAPEAPPVVRDEGPKEKPISSVIPEGYKPPPETVMGLCMVCGVAIEAAIERANALSLESLTAQVCKKYGVTLAELRGPRRTRNLARPRQEIFWRARHELPHLSLPSIGKYFDRDHTTVLHGVRVHQKRLDIAAAVQVVMKAEKDKAA